MEDHFDRLLNVDHTSSSSSSIGAPSGKFVESSKYTGSKKGYVFKLGEKGLGYYWDRGDNRYASSATERREDEEDEDYDRPKKRKLERDGKLFPYFMYYGTMNLIFTHPMNT